MEVDQMEDGKKHQTKRWTVSILALKGDLGEEFKVTRRIHELSVSETRMFRSKDDAKRQFEEWLE
ncbi:MAG: hypothetical protein AABX47_06210 [Nanoarchaeota archaeon]